MTALRSIVDDLVEKKLWPIAVALVVALVALPLAFGGGSSEEPAPAPSAAAPATGAPATADAAQVTLHGDAAVDKRVRKGQVRDPFKQLAKTSAGTESAADGGMSAPSVPTAGGAAPATSGGAGASIPSVPSVTPKPDVRTTPGTSTPAQRPAPSKAQDDERAEVVLRFGERGEELRRHDDPRRLTGLPSSSFPLLVYAGVRKDGKALRFVVNPLTRVTGDGRCRPSRDRCRTLEVRPGGTAFVDVLESPTKVAHYRVDVVRASR